MEERSSESTWSDWSDSGESSNKKLIGAVVAGVVAAVTLLALLRRQRHKAEEEELKTPAGLAGRARDAIGDERLQATREFVVEKILPEFKPALLSILQEVEDIVDNAFRRAEKSIKKL